jgi:hypothetical protein
MAVSYPRAASARAKAECSGKEANVVVDKGRDVYNEEGASTKSGERNAARRVQQFGHGGAGR